MIGGAGRKALEEEKSRAGSLSILIATPGRLLQHMDETPYFDCNALKILVLDEADRILDMGFRATLDAILENLPRGGRGGDGRQTLLFSTTQTKSVKDLARLNLSDPEYNSIHEEASMPTPVELQQAFVECPSSQKISVLWGFIKIHLKAKILVFFSICKQARFVSDAFSKLRPWENWTEGPQATTCVWIQRRSSTALPGGDPRRPIAVPLLRARSMRPRPRPRGRRSASDLGHYW
ncbi:DEAD box RNA helicase [Chloropicon roscoffensis]|uniref:ATP-dependent RNA helicase n=1 Tax=Chloropicon roscoffensis TaxID=1461544 RepID=A0AAX4PBR2_9CHLO